MKFPLDSTPYPRHPQSRPVRAGLRDGHYVYVVDEDNVVWVLRDGPHRHPQVLGNARPAKYAGDMRIQEGTVSDLTNLSGTFLFDDEEGLKNVAALIRNAGMRVLPGAVRFFPVDGLTRPRVLE